MTTAAETLGLLLVRDGLITRDQLHDAMRVQKESHRLLGTCLLGLGYITAGKLLDVLSRQLGVPVLPPGLLARASPAAVQRLPRRLAVKLRVAPFSWDGKLLGVAIADARVLPHLAHVAAVTGCAVGAYVALEMEIEAALGRLYEGPVEAAAVLDGRPRPLRAGGEAASLEQGWAFGVEASAAPAPPPQSAPASQRRAAPPRPAPKAKGRQSPALTKLSLYDAVEAIYEARDPVEIGRLTGQALLNYFERVLVLGCSTGSAQVFVLGGAGLAPQRALLNIADMPQVRASLSRRTLVYGLAQADPRALELAAALDVIPGATSLIVPLGGAGNSQIVAWADNGPRRELYDDLHDVEMLFKEVETALNLLLTG